MKIVTENPIYFDSKCKEKKAGFDSYSNVLGASSGSIKNFQVWVNTNKGTALKISGKNDHATKKAYATYGAEYEASNGGTIQMSSAPTLTTQSTQPTLTDTSQIGIQAKKDADAATKAKAAANPSDVTAQKAAADAKAKADSEAQVAADSAAKLNNGMSKEMKIGLAAGAGVLLIVVLIFALKKK